MNLLERTKEQVKAKGLLDKDSDYGGALGKAIIELMEVFCKQGHSGASAGFVLEAFHKLAIYNRFFSEEEAQRAFKEWAKEQNFI